MNGKHVISDRMYSLLQHLVINYIESDKQSQTQIAELLGLSQEQIDFLENNIIPDDDDGLHEIVD